ncbi:MAG: hypothetical protein OEZ01_02510 [Candidatus Heimdallarchaeota archaeon]|nr:hypothetical protein [Candidatus Heimdallarchaeota archaeon]MDH5644848.1 hypothetical protein [Candidatus Heimdallarchaeota archaeon]
MTIVTSKISNKVEDRVGYQNLPEVFHSNVDPSFQRWIEMAKERTFSLAAGNRIGHIAPKIMEIGFGKVLFAADQMGADIDQSNPFVIFAPDGTCSYNPIRTQRGFSYGAVLDFDFDGMMATNNSMPNGCGFSLYEITDEIPDAKLVNFLKDSQMRLGQDQLSQLGKGNHFAGVYIVRDPVTGEDTNKRFVVVHCSGHVGGHRLYHPDSWLSDTSGYIEVPTPHGSITLLEGEARRLYLEQYGETDKANSVNRDITVDEIFDKKYEWNRIEEITHQGLTKNSIHRIGTQIHKGLVPIAFNPEEGLIVVDTKQNLSREFIDYWKQGERIKQYGLESKMTNLNFVPHGGGYEFRHPVKSMEIRLGPEGIHDFNLHLNIPDGNMSFTYFREIREWMTYRRKTPIIREIARADLAEIVYDLPGLMQVYPLQSIPGGSH